MPLTEGKDFILVKNAFYSEPGFIRQSGNMLVTKNRVILNVIQTVDAKGAMSGSTSIKKEMGEAKESFNAIFEYGKRKKEIENMAQTTDDITDFENKVASMGAMHHKSINIPWSDIESYKAGFFSGFKLNLKDGSVIKIRSGKLGKIKKLVG